MAAAAEEQHTEREDENIPTDIDSEVFFVVHIWEAVEMCENTRLLSHSCLLS